MLQITVTDMVMEITATQVVVQVNIATNSQLFVQLFTKKYNKNEI